MNGCHNRKPFASVLYANDGTRGVAMQTIGGGCEPTRIPVQRAVPRVLSTDCQYTHSDAGRVDKGCNGCRWRADDGIGC